MKEKSQDAERKDGPGKKKKVKTVIISYNKGKESGKPLEVVIENAELADLGIPEHVKKMEKEEMEKAGITYIETYLPAEEVKKRLSKRPIEKDLLPIAFIDRVVRRDFLPMITHKGVFKHSDAPEKKDLIAKEETQLGRKLRKKEKIEVLNNAGYFKEKGFIFKSMGDYAIGFGYFLFSENEIKAFKERLEKDLHQPLLSEEEEKKRREIIERGLKKIQVYTLAHRLISIILSEYLEQKILTFWMPKRKIITRLGYDPDKDRHIHADIQGAITGLRYVDYKIYDYTGKAILDNLTQLTGSFLTDVRENKYEYRFTVNPNWIGCVQHMCSSEKRSRAQRKKLFARGYDPILAKFGVLSKHYKQAYYHLGQFLIAESGNKRIKVPGYKVVIFKGARYITEANLRYDRIDKNIISLLSTFKDLLGTVVDKFDPPLETLKKLSSKQFVNTKIRAYVKHPEKKLDQFLAGILKEKNRDLWGHL